MNEFDEILGFDPSQLEIFQEKTTRSTGNSLVYVARPTESKSEDGVYRAVIKPIYNPFNKSKTILEQQSYGMKDANGWFSVVSSLTNDDRSCPIFTAWKKCHFAEQGSALYNQALPEAKGGKGLFDKRFGRYITIQVIEDKNHPELEGKFMFWKLPKVLWEMIEAKIHPSAESKRTPIPVMDYLFGRAINLEVVPGPDDPQHPERKTREISYSRSEISEDIVSCINTDGSNILNDEEQQVLDNYVNDMRPVWSSRDDAARKAMIAEVNAKENTKKFADIYRRVIELIKSNCKNVEEELGYKAWTPEVAERVQKWIDAVLACQDPTIATTPDVVEAVESVTYTATPEVTPAPAASVADVDDDLPF